MRVNWSFPMNRYEFLCQSCPDPKSTFLTPYDLMMDRPVCDICQTKFIPNLAFFRDLETTRQEDREITPTYAKYLLEDVYLSAADEINWTTVAFYVERMKTNRWLNATEHMGGMYCPILRIDGTVLLGLQRLHAAVMADHTFVNTFVEVD